jgi:tRNA A37 methylthiotransferase MiaB
MLYFVSIAAVVAMTSVILVFQLGQPRIWMSMARDGLHLQGRTENGRVVLIAIESDHAKRLIGKLIAVKYTEALPHSLRGELVLQ